MKQKMVVVDDDEIILDMLDKVFNLTHDVEVVGFLSGGDALAYLSTHYEHIHIVMTDIRMPDVDGITLIQEARKISPFFHFIAITGMSTLDVVLPLLQEGVMDLVTKPFDFVRLKQIVNQAFLRCDFLDTHKREWLSQIKGSCEQS